MSWWEDVAKPNWRKWLPVVLLLGIALAYRLCILVSLEGDPFIATPVLDSAAYDNWGKEIATKSFWGERVFYQDPLYPYLLGIFCKIFGHHLFAVKLLQALIGTAGLWMLFEAGRRAMGYGAAIGALALAALYQTAAFYDVILLKEFLGPFFIEALLLCAAMGGRWWAGAGVALGMGALVRGNLLVLIPLVLALLAVKKDWKAMWLVAAGAGIVILPVTVRNYVVGREVVITTAQAGQNFYTGNNAGNWTGRYVPPPFVTPSPEFEAGDFKREAERRAGRPMTAGGASSFWTGEAVDAIKAEPMKFLGATGRRALLLVNAVELPDNFSIPFMKRYSWALAMPAVGFALVLAPLAAGGIYLAWIDRRKHALLFLILAGALVPVAFFFVMGRYRLPALPVLWLFGGYGIARFLELRAKGIVAVNRTAGIVAVVMFGITLIPIERVNFAVPFRNLAIYHLERKEPVSAVAAVEHMFGQKPELWRDLGCVSLAAACYEAAGKKGDALTAWKRAAEETGMAESWAAVGRMYGEMGDWEKAAAAYSKALPAFRIERAEALVRLNLQWEAVEALKIAVQEQPGARAMVALSRTYAGMGMWRESHEWAGKALEREPESREAWRLREEAAGRLK